MDQKAQPQNWTAALLAAVGLGVVAPFLLLPATKALVVAAIIAGVFILLIGGYALWRHRKRRKARERFVGFVDEATKGAPSGVDPKGLAELDALRKKFQEGIRVYKSRGKDLYSLPWFLLVGEPSAGKSEAVRHCGVGFPPGLTDYLQGTGGTVNMHWWFTDHAVVLDTAGKLMFSSVKPGESSLWQEFLGLLKKARSYCPINGLLLVLPVDSLIRDSANKISEKATLIAKQLDLIQRTLDVRFPVFVLVTKCDLLTGFREFFGGMDDIEATQQMLGWSNPDPLDASFRPELVDQHLEQVAERLRKRRMGMLRDPVETGPTHVRRIDAVDALYALPQSLLLIAPRLKRYLQTIFVAGEWAPKPVFLRGIYFTSSLQQGSPLDEALAALRGLSVEEMYHENTDERQEKTFFLYDLFTEKIFQEKGLVTRATNTLAMLRRRRWALLSIGAVALLLWAGVSSYGHFTLRNSIGTESMLWSMATSDWYNGTWKPIIRTNGPGSTWQYVGDRTVDGVEDKRERVGGKGRTLVEFHEELHTKTSSFSVPWIFWPIKFLIGDVSGRRDAQWATFEASVVRPLLEAARQKMQSASPGAESDEVRVRQANALEALIQVERDLLVGSKQHPINGRAANLLNWLLSYTTERSFTAPSNLVAMLVSYGESGRGDDAWLPKKLSGGSTLAENAAIRRGLPQFFTNTVIQAQESDQQFISLTEIRSAAAEFHRRETNFHRTVGSGQTNFLTELTDLLAAQAVLDRALAAGERARLFMAGQHLLWTNYLDLTNRSYQQAQRPLAQIRRAVSNNPRKILHEINTQLNEYAAASSTRFELTTTQTNLVMLLDRDYLAQTERGRRLYQVRAALYRDASDLAASVRGEIQPTGSDRFLQRFLRVHHDMEDYGTSANSTEVSRVCSAFFEQAADHHLRRQHHELTNRLGFPVIWDSAKLLNQQDLQQLSQLINGANNLVSTQTFRAFAPKREMEAFEQRLDVLRPVVAALGAIRSLKAQVDWEEHDRAVRADKGKGANLHLSDDRLLGMYRYLHFRVAGGSAKQEDIRFSPNPKILLADKFGGATPLEIDVRFSRDKDVVFRRKFEGGIFEWMWQSVRDGHEVVRRAGGWVIPLKVRPEPPGFIHIEVEVEMDPTKPLPLAAEWPVRKSAGL